MTIALPCHSFTGLAEAAHSARNASSSAHPPNSVEISSEVTRFCHDLGHFGEEKRGAPAQMPCDLQRFRAFGAALAG
jgi:hypothetical protein